MALASLMDSAVADSFLQSSIPNFQMALHLWASMDALVASSSSRVLLAFSQSSATSVGGIDAPRSSSHGYGRDGGGDPL